MQTFFELLPEKQNTSAALGFFDGLHIGHRKVIGEAVRGSENGLVPICFTFAQSPKSVLKNQPQEALMSVEDKKTALSEIGIQHLYMCDFKSVVDVAPRKFVEDMLIKTLKAKKLCCGLITLSVKTAREIPSCSPKFARKTELNCRFCRLLKKKRE